MVALGFFFPLLFAVLFYYTLKSRLAHTPWLLWLGVFSLFLGYLASQTGWIVAEVGRQPWAIQGMLPVGVATSNLTTGAVQTTFWMFAVLFTILLIAEIRIMTRQISLGPEEE
jgi:cytochrome d ubiquinol oxidase subunit I